MYQPHRCPACVTRVRCDFSPPSRRWTVAATGWCCAWQAAPCSLLCGSQPGTGLRVTCGLERLQFPAWKLPGHLGERG